MRLKGALGFNRFLCKFCRPVSAQNILALTEIAGKTFGDTSALGQTADRLLNPPAGDTCV
jgi:hypothetical protein